MTAKDVIKVTLDSSERILTAYLTGLDDADLLVHPLDGMNHIAWQVGHLIMSERGIVETFRPGISPPLPEGFEAAHPRGEGRSDDPETYWGTEEYLVIWKKQRAATLEALASLTEEELDGPAPERMHRVAKTVGAAFNLIGSHGLMHAGQFVATRRKLAKPIAI